MDKTEHKILTYLRSRKEANVYEIQANIDFWELNPIEKLKAILSKMIKEGKIKRGNPTKYRVVKAQPDTQQIEMF